LTRALRGLHNQAEIGTKEPPMYKVIGVDGKEYGPVSLEQLKQWVSEGRLTTQTRVQQVGAPDWKAATQIPELAALPAARTGIPAGMPAPLPIRPAVGQQTSLATTSLVLGILGFLTCLTSIPAVICGHIALNRAKKFPDQYGGSGQAIAGLVTGYVVIAILIFLVPIEAAMFLPALSRAKQKAMSIKCVNNVKQLDLALIMYASENNQRLPSSNQWSDAILPFVQNRRDVFRCASGPANYRAHYAFNSRLSDVVAAEIKQPYRTVLVFEETDSDGWNLGGDNNLFPVKGPHTGGAVVIGFVDGHVEIVRPQNLSKLKWEP